MACMLNPFASGGLPARFIFNAEKTKIGGKENGRSTEAKR